MLLKRVKILQEVGVQKKKEEIMKSIKEYNKFKLKIKYLLKFSWQNLSHKFPKTFQTQTKSQFPSNQALII